MEIKLSDIRDAFLDGCREMNSNYIEAPVDDEKLVHFADCYIKLFLIRKTGNPKAIDMEDTK